MDSIDFKRLREARVATDAATAEAFAKIEKLKASISAQVAVHQSEIGVARESFEAEARAVLETVSLEDFMDFDSARELYSLGWNWGVGSHAFTDAAHRVTQGTYVTRHMASWHHSEDGVDSALAWGVAIPEDGQVDEEVLARTADSVARLYSVVAEILGDKGCFFEVLEDTSEGDTGWYLSMNENGEWTVEERAYNQIYNNYSNSELTEVFRWMSKNLWYSGDVSREVLRG